MHRRINVYFDIVNKIVKLVVASGHSSCLLSSQAVSARLRSKYRNALAEYHFTGLPEDNIWLKSARCDGYRWIHMERIMTEPPWPVPISDSESPAPGAVTPFERC